MKTAQKTAKTANFTLIEKVSKGGNVYYALDTEQQTGNFKALFDLGKDCSFWVKILFIAELKKRCICIGNTKDGNLTQKEFSQILADTLTFEVWETKPAKKSKFASNKFSAKKTAVNDMAESSDSTIKEMQAQIKALTELLLQKA